ncbi:MAG: hypothetical protein EOO46_24760 [Flavobacterium sp.]|nr:MAG: hypothetical protein EOO46_24760 [Flavobacterium sp.]
MDTIVVFFGGHGTSNVFFRIQEKNDFVKELNKIGKSKHIDFIINVLHNKLIHINGQGLKYNSFSHLSFTPHQ